MLPFHRDCRNWGDGSVTEALHKISFDMWVAVLLHASRGWLSDDPDIGRPARCLLCVLGHSYEFRHEELAKTLGVSSYRKIPTLRSESRVWHPTTSYIRP